MTLEERRRLLMQLAEDEIEGVGCDGQVIQTQFHQDTPASWTGSMFSTNYGESFITSGAYYRATGMPTSPIARWDSTIKFTQAPRQFIPNLVSASTGVYLFQSITASAMGIGDALTLCKYTKTNSASVQKFINITTTGGNTNAFAVQAGSSVVVSPQMTKAIVAYRGGTKAVDLTKLTGFPSERTSNNLVSWIQQGTAAQRLMTASAASITASYFPYRSGSSVNQYYDCHNIVASMDENLTYCITWNGWKSASYSTDGAVTWNDLKSKLTTIVSQSGTDYMWINGAAISVDGKNSIVTTKYGVFTSDDYLNSFSFKSYTDLGIPISTTGWPGASGIFTGLTFGDFTRVAASSKLKRIYLWALEGPYSTNVSSMTSSLYISTDFGKTFARKLYLTGSQVVGNFPRALECSADGKTVMLRAWFWTGSYSVNRHNYDWVISRDAGETWNWYYKPRYSGMDLDLSLQPLSYLEQAQTDMYKEYPGFPSHSFNI